MTVNPINSEKGAENDHETSRILESSKLGDNSLDGYDKAASQLAMNDYTLFRALQDGKIRMFLLLLEKQLLKWIDSNLNSLELEPMNGYLRLLSHKMAEYYKVDHTSNMDGTSVVWYKPVGGKSLDLPVKLADIDVSCRAGSSTATYNGLDGDTKVSRPTIMTKKPPLVLKNGESDSSCNPIQDSNTKLLNSSLQNQQQQQCDCTGSNNLYDDITHTNCKGTIRNSETIMTETTANDHDETNNAFPPKGLGSFEAREAAYEEARARIFKDFTEQNEQHEILDDDADRKQVLAQLEAMHDPDYVKGPLSVHSSMRWPPIDASVSGYNTLLHSPLPPPHSSSSLAPPIGPPLAPPIGPSLSTPPSSTSSSFLSSFAHGPSPPVRHASNGSPIPLNMRTLNSYGQQVLLTGPMPSAEFPSASLGMVPSPNSNMVNHYDHRPASTPPLGLNNNTGQGSSNKSVSSDNKLEASLSPGPFSSRNYASMSSLNGTFSSSAERQQSPRFTFKGQSFIPNGFKSQVNKSS